MQKIGLEAILELAGFRKNLKEYDSSVKGMGATLEATGGKMMAAGAKMTAGVTLPLAALAGVAIDAASDLSESLNKVNVVFKESGSVIAKWSELSAKALGLSQRQALEAAGTFGNLFTAMGMGAGEAASLSTNIVGLASDLASFNNIPIDQALEKLRSGLVGETEPLRTLGVNIDEASVKAEALRLGLARAGEELNAQQKIQARYSLIMKQTANAQGDFARTSDGLANSQRILKAELADATAQLGTSLMPIMQDVVGWASQLVGKFTELGPETQKVILLIAGLAAAAGPATTAIGGLVSALGAMIANPVLVGLGLLAAGIAALVVQNAAARDAMIETAAQVLDTAGSYAEYKREAEKAGAASKIMSEGLYDVYKNAKKAGSEVDALTFQKAVDSAEAAILKFYGFQQQTAGFVDEFGNFVQVTAFNLDAFLAQVTGAMPAMTDLQLSVLGNTQEMERFGQYLGLTGADLTTFVTTTTQAATAQGYFNSRAAESSSAIQAERDQLAAAKGGFDGYKAAVDAANDSTVTIFGSVYTLGTRATTTKTEVTNLGTALAASITQAAPTITSQLDTVIAKWDELTVKEREAVELQLAQTLLSEARQMLADGEITLPQYTELWAALRGEVGSLVDPTEATSGAIMALFGQWATGKVDAGKLAGAVGNLNNTISTATKEAKEAESAFIKMGGGIDTVDEALKNLPSVTTITVNLVLTGDPNLIPQSPHTMMEYALDNLAKKAKDVRKLMVGVSGGPMFAPVNVGGAVAGSNVSNTTTSIGGDTIVLNINSRDAWAGAQSWIESRRRERINVGM